MGDVVLLADPDDDGEFVEVEATVATDGNGLRLAVGNSSTRATVVWKVNHEQRFLAFDGLLGHTTVRSGSGVNYLHRQNPHSMFWYAGELAHLRCVGVTDTEGRGHLFKPEDGPQGPNFRWHYLTATYEPLPYDILEDDAVVNPAWGSRPDEALLTRYVRLPEITDASKLLTVRAGVIRFVDNHRPLTQGMQLPQSEWDLVYQWIGCPLVSVPYATILGTMNKSNAAEFDGYDVETLFLRTWKQEHVVHPNGMRAVNLSYFFRWVDGPGVNYFPDPARRFDLHEAEFFDPIAGTTRKPFPTAPFADLFRPA